MAYTNGVFFQYYSSISGLQEEGLSSYSVTANTVKASLTSGLTRDNWKTMKRKWKVTEKM